MKISIVVPVYNEENKIKDCLNALFNIDYNKDNFEILVVNDGSSDNTQKILESLYQYAKRKSIDVKLINLKSNKGRIIARETGVRKAKHNLILLIDSRCVADRNILKYIKKINYQPIDGELIIDGKRSIWDRFNWLRARLMYYPHWGEDYEPVYITPDNFDKMGKGANNFFVSKDLYLASIPERGKNRNDDTKLFRNIVKQKNILRHPQVRVYYQSRTSLKKEIPHIFHRGPRFVDYYFNLRKKYFWLFIAFPVLSVLSLTVLVILNPFIVFNFLIIAIIALIVISVWMAQNVKDFFIVLLVLPITAISFELGVFKGLLLKLFKKY